MDEKNNEIIKLIIKDYLGMIFGYSLRRTNSREDAEDLAQDILTELVSSIHSLKNPEAYTGWMWAVAGNTYKRWLRKRKNDKHEYLEEYQASGIFNIAEDGCLDEDIINREDLNRLRWEISLLSSTYRNIVVSYYVDEISCGEIAQKYDLALDTVKYFLYKARNVIREGINMNRELGEKSYKPAEFFIKYWGDHSVNYSDLLNRKLPGNILLTAIYKPVSLSEISLETGVPVAYLEDEIDILEAKGLINRLKGDKYQTAIIIFTKKMNGRIDSIFKQYASDLTKRLLDELSGKEVEIRKVGFYGSNLSWEKLLWCMLQAVMTLPVADSLHYGSVTRLPLLKQGNHGWVWGAESTVNPWDCGITNKSIVRNCGAQDKYAVLIDFPALETDNQRFIDTEKLALLCKVKDDGLNVAALSDREKEVAASLAGNGYVSIKNGILKSEIGILTYDQGEQIMDILKNAYKLYDDSICEVQTEVAKLMFSEVPKHLHNQIAPIAYVKTISGMLSAVIEDVVRETLWGVI
jgi:RNA polymerase sigma factor (sigma-70 family)